MLRPSTTFDQRSPGEPLVVLSGVDEHVGALHVLKGIDLTVHRGEVLVVIGPSGSGESTPCRAINRLETIDAGSITLASEQLPEEGEELAQLRADAARSSSPSTPSPTRRCSRT